MNRVEAEESILVTARGAGDPKTPDAQKCLQDFDRDHADLRVTFVAPQLGIFSGDANRYSRNSPRPSARGG